MQSILMYISAAGCQITNMRGSRVKNHCTLHLGKEFQLYMYKFVSCNLLSQDQTRDDYAGRIKSVLCLILLSIYMLVNRETNYALVEL